MTAASWYLKYAPDVRLSEPIRATERALNYSRREANKVARLADRKIHCLDVGARGGILDYLKPYADLLDVVLVEPDPEEAARLKNGGFRVVEGILDEKAGSAQLNLTVNPANASLLAPTGPIMHYYAGGDLARFEIVARPEFTAVTLDDIAAELGESLDYVKLDTQGNEYGILRGGQAARPLFIVSEVSTAALYEQQGLLYDIGTFLHDRGYLLFDLSLRTVRPRPPGHYLAKGQRPSLGLPLHGDAYFMPDWTRPAGRELIRGRERVWAALMTIHGLEEVVRYVLDASEIDHSDEIRAALG